jgi:hypothetical protein
VVLVGVFKLTVRNLEAGRLRGFISLDRLFIICVTLHLLYSPTTRQRANQSEKMSIGANKEVRWQTSSSLRCDRALSSLDRP